MFNMTALPGHAALSEQDTHLQEHQPLLYTSQILCQKSKQQVIDCD